MVKRVLFFGSYDVGEGYPRARSLQQALEAWGVEVHHLREDLLPGRGERLKAARQIWRWPALCRRLFKGGQKLKERLRSYLQEHEIDAILVPYPGHFCVRWVREIWNGPLFLDLFLSLEDTVVYDRAYFEPRTLPARLMGWLDRRACDVADLVLLDTPEHAARVSDLTGLPESRFGFVPIGDPDAPAEPYPWPERKAGESLPVLYCGTGVPLHGVPEILEACSVAENIRLTFVGGTGEQRDVARALGDDRVEVIDRWVSRDELSHLFREHSLHFGIFGQSQKADRVVPYKVVHALAAGRAVVTLDSSAVNTLLTPGQDCYTVPRGDTEAIVRVLHGAVEAPQILRKVGERARHSYERMFSPRAIGQRLLFQVEESTGSAWINDGAESTDEGRVDAEDLVDSGVFESIES